MGNPKFSFVIPGADPESSSISIRSGKSSLAQRRKEKLELGESDTYHLSDDISRRGAGNAEEILGIG